MNILKYLKNNAKQIIFFVFTYLILIILTIAFLWIPEWIDSL